MPPPTAPSGYTYTTSLVRPTFSVSVFISKQMWRVKCESDLYIPGHDFALTEWLCVLSGVNCLWCCLLVCFVCLLFLLVRSVSSSSLPSSFKCICWTHRLGDSPPGLPTCCGLDTILTCNCCPGVSFPTILRDLRDPPLLRPSPFPDPMPSPCWWRASPWRFQRKGAWDPVSKNVTLYSLDHVAEYRLSLWLFWEIFSELSVFFIPFSPYF